MMPMGVESEGGDKAEEKRKYQTRDALSLLNRVQEMAIIDPDELMSNKEAVGVLQKVHGQLGELLANGQPKEEDTTSDLSEDDASEKIRNLGFGRPNMGREE